MLPTVGMLASIAEIAGQAAGVPVAASLASEIVKSCEDVAKYKVSEIFPYVLDPPFISFFSVATSKVPWD